MNAGGLAGLKTQFYRLLDGQCLPEPAKRVVVLACSCRSAAGNRRHGLSLSLPRVYELREDTGGLDLAECKDLQEISGLYHMKSKAVFKVCAMDSAQLVGTCLASTKPGVDTPALSKLW